MKRVMIDLETLDVSPTAVVSALGAVEFDLTGPLARFYKVLELGDQQAHGRTMRPQTVCWWMGQSAEAREIYTSPTMPKWHPKHALGAFAGWIDEVCHYDPDEQVEVWGNGSDFDNVILGSLYEAYDVKRPWSYSNNRCYRTLKNLGIKLAPGQGVERVGTHHNALDDAIYQAHYAAAYLRHLGGAV